MKLHLKGKGNYCAVLIDLDKSKLVAILQNGHKKKLPKLWLGGVGKLEQIEEVSIDLWSLYKSLVEELMPSAQVVADRFHVMKQVNNELDAERKKQKTWGSSSQRTTRIWADFSWDNKQQVRIT